MNKTEKFYDDLSGQYHLVTGNWDEAVQTQGRILSNLLGSLPLHIMDCSCAIGTQAIGLALHGHNVLASDLSSKAVERAKLEANRLKVKMQFAVSDFYEVPTSGKASSRSEKY